MQVHYLGIPHAVVADFAGPEAVIEFENLARSVASREEALRAVRTKLEYFPEWFFTGSGYADLGLVARGYPTEQSQHAFGLSFIYPWTAADTPAQGELSYADKVDPLNWYWGVDAGTQNARLTTPVIWWLLAGIHTAGPRLTPQTFKQGLFSIPPRGGALAGQPDTSLVAYGKGPKLPERAVELQESGGVIKSDESVGKRKRNSAAG
jgi:hypothetical protein